MNTNAINHIFTQSINTYHLTDCIDTPIHNPYSNGSIQSILYLKNWIDTIQWHLEDIIRNPLINPLEALQLKRRIDHSNQERTDLVERIDSYYLDKHKNVTILPSATINTESPAWAIDRLSILALKIYHMHEETLRTDALPDHVARCREKLATLLQQQTDLTSAIDDLLNDIAAGRKYMKAYRQMKMYNDPALNPILYTKPQ